MGIITKPIEIVDFANQGVPLVMAEQVFYDYEHFNGEKFITWTINMFKNKLPETRLSSISGPWVPWTPYDIVKIISRINNIKVKYYYDILDILFEFVQHNGIYCITILSSTSRYNLENSQLANLEAMGFQMINNEINLNVMCSDRLINKFYDRISEELNNYKNELKVKKEDYRISLIGHENYNKEVNSFKHDMAEIKDSNELCDKRISHTTFLVENDQYADITDKTMKLTVLCNYISYFTALKKCFEHDIIKVD